MGALVTTATAVLVSGPWFFPPFGAFAGGGGGGVATGGIVELSGTVVLEKGVASGWVLFIEGVTPVELVVLFQGATVEPGVVESGVVEPEVEESGVVVEPEVVVEPGVESGAALPEAG